jgi:phosphoadenosine phosphosulfate reductase
MPISLWLSEKRKRQCLKLVELSKAVIREAFDRFKLEELGIVWTGGKDSSFTLWCVLQVCREREIKLPKTLMISRGDELKEVEEFVRTCAAQWEVPLDVRSNSDVLKAAGRTFGAVVRVGDLNERNREELESIGINESEFPLEADSYIGKHLLETAILHEWIERNGIKCIIQGLRWDEDPAKFDVEYIEFVEGSRLVPEHSRVCPILHFTERDLWASSAAFGVPFCSLYEDGYRCLGSRSTSSRNSNIPAWEQDLDNTEERRQKRHEQGNAIERLRKLGYI